MLWSASSGAASCARFVDALRLSTDFAQDSDVAQFVVKLTLDIESDLSAGSFKG
jgi:hypothetical protein